LKPCTYGLKPVPFGFSEDAVVVMSHRKTGVKFFRSPSA
jgi:hypothetical protein